MDRFTENEHVYAKCHDCRLKLVIRKNICSICGIRANYNIKDESYGVRCRIHKEVEMIDVRSKRCIICKIKGPSFNNKGETIATHCGMDPLQPRYVQGHYEQDRKNAHSKATRYPYSMD